MNNIEELKRFIYSATVTSGSGSQSFYIDAKNREEADKRAANNESDGMYADDSEVTDLAELDYEDETTVDDFGDFPLISREQSLIDKLEAAQKELSDWRSVAEAAAQDDADWHKLVDSKNDVISHLASGIINLKVQLRASRAVVAIYDENLAKAEAELSAANEKLSKPVEFPDSDIAAVSHIAHWYSEKQCEAWVAGVEFSKKQIKAAGFTVEGNADAE
ncbi:hypothetical protein [Yersinia pseudotuberculosis]|uniref:hypothetical protein n=1 Tax=Yersinia pseudotuberculosis TaxID=633 RepID=UPI002B29890C|nr:hypothetical protein YPSE1_27530 [Yersinia pseudotuberculosis]BET63378.1 hypothetical protein YPSE1_28370 [Yersinia pseudotuberculosis]BET64837.1 hypothetical protein YPSE1_42960 [Yersinia pseudotuberculosis]